MIRPEEIGRLPRGIDYVRGDAEIRRAFAERVWHEVAQSYGYSPVAFPAVGFAETFRFGHNASGDRTYEFRDRAGRMLALCSDSLPLALMAANETFMHGEKQANFSYTCPIFRYRRLRKRSYHHMGAFLGCHTERSTVTDGIGLSLGSARIASRYLTRVGVPAVMLVNHMGFWHREVADAARDGVDFGDATRLEDQAVVLRDNGRTFKDWSRVEAAVTFDQGLDVLRNFCVSKARGDLIGTLETFRRGFSSREGAIALRLAMTNFHASEFHSGLAFQWVDATTDVRLGDGGDYSEYASSWLGYKVSVASAVVRLEDVAERIGVLPPEQPLIVIHAPQGADEEVLRTAALVQEDLISDGFRAQLLFTAPGKIQKLLERIENTAAVLVVLVPAESPPGVSAVVRNIKSRQNWEMVPSEVAQRCRLVLKSSASEA